MVPEFQKLDDSYSLILEYDAQTTMVDDVYGELHGPYLQRDILYEKVIERDGDILTIESSVTGTNVLTDEVMFHVDNIYKVNAYTLTHVDKEGKRFKFLPGVEKKNYDFFHSAVFYDDPMTFKKTDVVNGLETYVFEVVTNGADTSRAFPQFAPHVILTDTTSRLWIEPTTGNLVKFEKEWDNYLVENGKRVNTIQIGGKHTTEFTELILTQHARAEIENLKTINFWIPALLSIIILGVGTIWILLTFLYTIKKESLKKEQMAIIGNIAANIAHDLKNPLTVIKGNIDVLKHTNNSEIKKNIELIQKSTDKISYQINSIMNFVRNKPLQKEKIPLKTVLEASIENSQIPDDIHLEKDIPDITVTVDVNQIETAFSNIITNSIQAINEGTIAISAKENSKHIEIIFSDSGPGIPKSNIKKIFEPLYTTKKTVQV
ncbi:histidine kinase [Candidatus Nitrosopumilus koreensis AR1]|uniref:Histidine kinase n=1 Tax=Candidatus Nitrosopumilus koreensis AR1 TaxID=1229908 RepID=K0B819_9ARCH|nr:histidine kinase [Candidatus Nitrosopumilus koreensis AR1]